MNVILFDWQRGSRRFVECKSSASEWNAVDQFKQRKCDMRVALIGRLGGAYDRVVS